MASTISRENSLNDPLFWQKYYSIFFTPVKINDAIKEVYSIIEFLRFSSDSKILDLCCGVGRHAIPFAQIGFEVTGIDFCNELIRQAKENAGILGIPIKFECHNIFDFSYNCEFDIITSFANSFGYFENNNDNEKVLEMIFQSLTKNGVFILDTVNADFFKIETVVSTRSGEDFYVTKSKNKKDGFLESDWAITLRGVTQGVRFKQAVFKPEEIIDILKSIGYKNIGYYSDFKLNSYNNGKRIIYIAQK